MNINEMIEILQACKEGENIQTKYKGGSSFWGVIDNPPTWNFEEYDFRVKPEPREFYLSKYDIEYGNRITVCHDGSHNQGLNNWVKVREVLDNE